MRFIVVLFLVGCVAKPAPDPQIPVVDIPSTARDFPEPEWEEPTAKISREDAAENLKKVSSSLGEFMMLHWHTPPP